MKLSIVAVSALVLLTSFAATGWSQQNGELGVAAIAGGDFVREGGVSAVAEAPRENFSHTPPKLIDPDFEPIPYGDGIELNPGLDGCSGPCAPL